MPAVRRFPPWTIEEHAVSFIVRDATGQAPGYFYTIRSRSALLLQRMPPPCHLSLGQHGFVNGTRRPRLWIYIDFEILGLPVA
jgi:hypothetical protein